MISTLADGQYYFTKKLLGYKTCLPYFPGLKSVLIYQQPRSFLPMSQILCLYLLQLCSMMLAYGKMSVTCMGSGVLAQDQVLFRGSTAGMGSV